MVYEENIGSINGGSTPHRTLSIFPRAIGAIEWQPRCCSGSGSRCLATRVRADLRVSQCRGERGWTPSGRGMKHVGENG